MYLQNLFEVHNVKVDTLKGSLQFSSQLTCETPFLKPQLRLSTISLQTLDKCLFGLAFPALSWTVIAKSLRKFYPSSPSFVASFYLCIFLPETKFWDHSNSVQLSQKNFQKFIWSIKMLVFSVHELFIVSERPCFFLFRFSLNLDLSWRLSPSLGTINSKLCSSMLIQWVHIMPKW